MPELSVKDIDAAFRPVETRVRMCLRADLVAELGTLEEQLRVAKARDDGSLADTEVHDIAQRILNVQVEAQANEVEFVFQSVGRRKWTDLLLAHPASEAQLELEPDIPYDLETFPAAAMNLSCVSPADADEAWWLAVNTEWNVGQVQRLWDACLRSQTRVADAPKASATASAVLNGSAKR